MWFCSHCGVSASVTGSSARVCTACGLGLILDAGSDIAPTPNSAFIVLDESLSVCAVSREAETLLGITETAAVNRHLTAFLGPAESDPDNARDLALAIIRAAKGSAGFCEVTVRPIHTYGVRLHARIGSCGPRSAALMVLQ